MKKVADRVNGVPYSQEEFDLLVLDIGGGSLELASGADEEPDVALSLPLGAGQHGGGSFVFGLRVRTDVQLGLVGQGHACRDALLGAGSGDARELVAARARSAAAADGAAEPGHRSLHQTAAEFGFGGEQGAFEFAEKGFGPGPWRAGDEGGIGVDHLAFGRGEEHEADASACDEADSEDHQGDGK